MTYPILTFGHPALPPVVMLHGFLGQGWDWAPIAESLADQHHVLCPDLPGHGDHMRTGDFPRFEEVALELHAALAARGVNRFGLVGYSMGGRLALHYALSYPAQITRLVLESCSPGIDDAETRESRMQHDDALADELDTIAEPSGMLEWLGNWYASPLFASLRARPDLVETQLRRRMRQDPAGLATAMRAFSPGRQPSLWEKLPELAPPTLFIHGELDTKYAAIGEQMAERSDKVARFGVGGCGHNVHLESPTAYTVLIKPFLAG